MGNVCSQGMVGFVTTDDSVNAELDPIVARRNRMRRVAMSAQRTAYALLALATLLFFVGLITSFSDGLVTAIVVPLVSGSVILAVAIQVVYAVRGAERHETDSAAQRRQ